MGWKSNHDRLGLRAITRLLTLRDTVLATGRRRGSATGAPTEPLERHAALDGALHCSRRSVGAFAETFAGALADRSSIFVIPSQIGDELVLGLRREDVVALDATLADLGQPDAVWRGDKAWAGRLRIRRAPRVPHDGGTIRARLDEGPGAGLTIKARCYADLDGALRCGDATGSIPRTLHAPMPRKGTPPRTIDHILGGRPTTRTDLPIDVVYTWVDYDDPDWRRLYDAAMADGEEPADRDRSGAARFLSRRELMYSLRSVEENLPWVRTIHVLTNCAKPAWLGDRPDIRWIDHSEVMAERHLPTFNSHAIESCLHRIEGLSEHFVYLNDDMFINERMRKRDVFTPSGQSVLNLEDYGMVGGRAAVGDPDYLNAARNGAALMRDRFGPYPTQLHRHAPYALRRGLLDDMERTWPEAFERTRAARFRSITDISATSFLHHHYAFHMGAAVRCDYPSALVKPTTRRFARKLDRIASGRTDHRTVCVNDGVGSVGNTAWDDAVRSFLERRFPVPTTAETG